MHADVCHYINKGNSSNAGVLFKKPVKSKDCISTNCEDKDEYEEAKQENAQWKLKN